MSKPLKRMLSENLRQRYEGVESCCVVDLTGLDVQQTQSMRVDLKNKNIRLEVVKNSMARLAFKDAPLGPLAESLKGPCAMATGGDGVVDVAKTLVEWAKEYPQITLKQAIIEGDPDLMSVADVSKMKSRLETIGEIAMLVSSPGRSIAGCVSSPQSKVAGCLKAMIDKAEAA